MNSTANSEQYSTLGTTQVSKKAPSRMREDFEEQEKQLDEMNAILANINMQNAAKTQELKRQDKQLDAVTGKQTETMYKVEKSSRKLNKLL